MPAVEIEKHELQSFVGREVAITDWLEVTQERIDQFAAATGDLQWIHVDVERARSESPYRGTVAHGFLTLSLLPYLIANSVKLLGFRMGINYGFNRVRFSAPVLSGARLRARFTLNRVEHIPGGIQLTWAVMVECEGADKPSLVAEWLSRRYE